MSVLKQPTFNTVPSELEQYKLLLENIPEFIDDLEYYGDRVLIRFFKKESLSKSDLYIPDTKLVPTASELKVTTALKEDKEKMIPRAVVVSVASDSNLQLKRGDVVEISPTIGLQQILAVYKQFDFSPTAVGDENFYFLPSSFIIAKWQTSEAYLDFQKKLTSPSN